MARLGNVRLITLLAIAGLSTAVASEPDWEGEEGACHFYVRLWNPRTIESVTGVVTRIEPVSPGQHMPRGLVAELKLENETLPVHLGPAWFLAKEGLEVNRRDILEITGSRVTFAGKPALLAQTVRKGGKSFFLRDEAGIPTWAPARMLGPMRGPS